MSDHPVGAPANLPRWPADPTRFVDTTSCPSCLSTLASARCTACGLDLAVPEAVELLASGRRIHDESERREAIIRGMYAAQAAAATTKAAQPVPVAARTTAPTTWVAPVTPAAPVAAVAPVAAGAPVAPVASAAPEASAAPSESTPAAASQSARPAPSAAEATAPRRSGVQLFLLTLGVVLISVAAIVFLFVAYLVASLEVRSVIIAVASVLVLGVAWLLRRRRLPGTAEGVASVAVVLLLLDVWIVRANGLFGSDLVEAASYTGGAFLVVAAVLAGARAVSGIRVAGYAAAGLVPVGVFLLGFGAAPDDEAGTAVWIGGLAASVVGSLAALAPRSMERTVVSGAGFAGGVLSLLAAPWALPDVTWHQLWAFLGSAAAWGLALVTVRRLPHLAWARAAAGLTGLALTLGPAVSLFTELESDVAIWATPAATGAVACLLAAFVGRREPRRASAALALGASLVVAALTAGFGAVIGIGAITERLARSVPPWGGGLAESLPAPTTLQVGAALVPAIAGLGAAAVLLIVGRLGPLRAVPIGAFGVAVLVAGAIVPSDPVATAILMGLGVLALAVAAIMPMPAGPAVSVRIVLAAVGVSGAAFGWTVGFADSMVWPWTSAFALLALAGGRVLASRIWGASSAPIGLVHSAALGVLAATTLGVLVPWLDARGVAFAEPVSTAWICLGTGAAVFVGLAALPRLAPSHDRIAFAVPMLLAAVLAVGTLPLHPTGTDWTWLPAAALAGAGALWLRPSAPQPLRVTFAALVPLSTGMAAGAVAVSLLDADALGYVLAGVTLVTAALAHVLARPRPDAAAVAWIASVVLVGGFALSAVAFTPGEPWLILAVLVPVPIVLTSIAGDPIAGQAPTRHLAWISAVLAIASLFSWLAGDGVDTVEAYTLPLAALLAVCGALITWRRVPAEEASTSRGRTALFASAAAIAVLPSVGSTAASDLRTLVLVAGGAILMLAAMFLPERSRGVPARLLSAATGWTAMSAAAVVRGTAVATGSDSPLPIEFWPVLSLLGGLALAIAWARTSSRPTLLADWLAAASVVLGAIPTVAAIMVDDSATLRAGVLLIVLGAAVVAGAATSSRPFAGPVIGWAMRGALVFGGLFALVSGNVDPADVITVPIGLALIAAGALTMARKPIGSWPALGGGIAVLLLPPLGADFTDPQLWRIVALGVAALVILVVGAQRRLQAPFVLGGAVLLVHAVVQLWPAITIVYEAVWWWLWLGIAGVLLVVLAATYERQLRLARNTIRSIAAMR